MAKFLNTSGANYHLEELIKKANERLILISPYLQFNARLKELLEDKNRLKIDVRVVYGKSQLNPSENQWLQSLAYVRAAYCENLHAKCYLSENECIITSLNLYEFSQVNNNEMGVLIDRVDDEALYNDVYDEALRIVRIAKENPKSPPQTSQVQYALKPPRQFDKITTACLARRLGFEPVEFTQLLADNGYIDLRGGTAFLTDKGREVGGEVKKGAYGYFIVWSVDMSVSFEDEKTEAEEKGGFADKLKNLFGF